MVLWGGAIYLCRIFKDGMFGQFCKWLFWGRTRGVSINLFSVRLGDGGVNISGCAFSDTYL